MPAVTLSSRLRSRTAGSALAGVLALALLAGCGGGGGSSDTEDKESGAEPSDQTSSSVPPEPYVEVPEGVELTEPGTALDLGDPAVVGWEPRQDKVAVLRATVAKIERTTFKESFQGWQIDDEMATRTPYFVRVSVRNEVADNLGTLAVPLYASVGQTLVEATRFEGEFKPCTGGVLPKKFKKGARADLCLVYLLERGSDLSGIAFQPAEEEPILWSGKITNIAKPAKKPGKQQQ